MVDAVGRAEENRLCADRAFDETLRQIQLPFNFGFGDLIESRMGKRVIADFVAFGVLALENFRVLVGYLTDDEENGRRILFLEDVENFWGPARIGTVVDRKDDFLAGRAAHLVAPVGKRVFFLTFVG